MADDLHARLSRVEQRVEEIDRRTQSMVNVVTRVATLNERVETLRDDFADFRRRQEERDRDFLRKMEQGDDERRSREESSRKERRAAIRWAMTLTVTLFGILLASAIAIFVH